MNHPDRLPAGGVVRRSGEVTPFNAADAVAAVCDAARERSIIIPSGFRARLGKAAKSLLEDGFAPAEVVAAMVMAVRRGRPDLVEHIVVDMQNATMGWLVTPQTYRRELADYVELANNVFALRP